MRGLGPEGASRAGQIDRLKAWGVEACIRMDLSVSLPYFHVRMDASTPQVFYLAKTAMYAEAETQKSWQYLSAIPSSDSHFDCPL